MNPSVDIYKANTPGAKRVRIAAKVSMGAFLLTLGTAFYAWEGGPQRVTLLYMCIAVWAVVPAWWFWYEYFFIYRKYGADDTLDLFKYGQQIAIAIWAGVTLCLVALAASAHFKAPDSSPPKCESKG